ncbi:S9 family peptidase [Mycobacterium sp. MS1601]|uniref:S9 family peptidase n=1 Tax=Mycobacterium sp. MS1601 TaxID=1936029 RepID=UPI0009792951|nr:S9 family peptidase [Mycobacterium sp. MS1601]AQA04485.1 S9 family peptidase [Mycobacterium sp. MS1601]
MTSPFDDLDDYLALPRITDLAASADGSRVVMALSELAAKTTEFRTALWELDPSGIKPARRLTRGAKGESSPTFTAGGDLLFLAARPDADDDTPPAALWRLPAAGGEAEKILSLPGGVSGVHTARAAERTVVSASLLPSAADLDEEKRLRDLRKDSKVSAILHTGYPVRYWDADLGPAQPHLLDADSTRDLTPMPGDALRESKFDVSADGTFIVAAWRRPGPGASLRSVLVRIDVATGDRSVIADDPDADLESPVISPDGTQIAFTRESLSTPHQAPRITLCRMVFGSDIKTVAPDWDRWPAAVTWAADGAALLVVADDRGRSPVFRVTLDGTVTRLTVDDFAYTSVTVTDTAVFALRSSYASPPHPVRIDTDGTVTVLPSVDLPALPGELTEIEATAADGRTVRSWLVLPDADDPAPLLLWIHGGPLGSWNAWSWRWNPWLLAAKGYAVLLPDPALSTGYGQDFIQLGWGAWGGPPYDDLMVATDAACAHPRIDETRTAAMGGSFGGYMANWVAGHTDRFAAIVTHASLWALDQFGATTDSSYYWLREMTPEMAEQNSPHRHVANISTPMLVIHGDKDYRVPIGEALRLWFELLTASGLPADDSGQSPHRFLYFPSENHWVLTPQHAKLWYQVVTAFLAEHVLGETSALPETLG